MPSQENKKRCFLMFLKHHPDHSALRVYESRAGGVGDALLYHQHSLTIEPPEIVFFTPWLVFWSMIR